MEKEDFETKAITLLPCNLYSSSVHWEYFFSKENHPFKKIQNESYKNHKMKKIQKESYENRKMDQPHIAT